MATRHAVRVRETAGELLVRKLLLRSDLTAAECDVLSALPFVEHHISSREYLARQGSGSITRCSSLKAVRQARS